MPVGVTTTGASMDTRKAFIVDIIAGAIAPQQQKAGCLELSGLGVGWQSSAAADALAVCRLLMQSTLQRMTAAQ
jgi:hypothetical protein